MKLHRRSTTIDKGQQKGFGILSALLALVIGSIVSVGVIEGKQTEAQLSSGRIQGDLLNLIRGAANQYALENYPELQNNLPITRNGVTLGTGNGIGQTLSPRVEDLVALGYLPAGFSSQAAAIEGATYRMAFQQAPVGCVAAACDIPGTLYIDQPIVYRGTTSVNGTIVGAIITRIGGDALVSLRGSAGQMSALSGAAVANPVPTTPPGVVGSRIGFGATGFGEFLVVNDPRDPNFRNNVTIAGTVIAPAGNITTVNSTTVNATNVVATNSVGSGTGTTGCRLAEVLADGQFISRAANCVVRAVMNNWTTYNANTAGTPVVGMGILPDGSGVLNVHNSAGTLTTQIEGQNGRIGLNGYAPDHQPPGWGGGIAVWDIAARGAITAWDGVTPRASLWRNGNIFSSDEVGRVRAAMDSTGTIATADASGATRSLMNAGGAIVSYNASGVVMANLDNDRATGPVLRSWRGANANTACNTGNNVYADIVTNADGLGLLMCNGAVWVPITMYNGSLGGDCAPEGTLSVTPAGETMICTNGKLARLIDRMGKRIFAESYVVSDGGTVNFPPCASGSTGQMIFLTPKDEEVQFRYVNRYATAGAGLWTVRAVDGNGNSIAGSMLASTYCVY